MTITQEQLTTDSAEVKQEAFFPNDRPFPNLSNSIKAKMFSL